MRLRLQARYTIIIVTLIVTIMLSLSAVLLHQFQSSTRRITTEGTGLVTDDLLEQVKKRAAIMATTLGNNLVNPLYLYNMEQMQQLLQVAKTEEEVKSVTVYDPRGRIVHDGRYKIRNYGKPVGQLGLALAATRSKRIVQDRRDDQLYVAYPILLGQEPIGGVLMELSLEKMLADVSDTRERISEIGEESLRHNAYTVVALTILLAGLGALLAIIIASRLIQPVRKLAVYAAQIGHGNYDVKFDVRRDDELGDLANALEEMRDNLRRSHDEIRFLAYHDRLTGLPNRAMFREYLDRALENAMRKGQALALLFIDVDNFKRINDTFGHQAGDLVLQTLASRVSSCLRAQDLITTNTSEADDAVAARLGGDEFIALVPISQNPLDAAHMARRILTQFEQPIAIETEQMFISASIGIALFPADGMTSTELTKNADMAMYHAKFEGKNTYKYFTEALNQRVRHSMEVELELRKALERGELAVYYQPQMDLASGNIVGAEALVRWLHPTRGMIEPDDFISVAEDTGLIVPIGEHIIREAAKQAYAWRKIDPNIYISVNVSSLQCRRQDLASIIENVLHETGAPAEALHMELTESNLMKVEDKAKQQLDRIRALGMRVWIDDFGTGYSSLSYLRRFAVDGVKIDRSFIRNLRDSEDDRSLTRAIIAMAHSLKLGVIAEGVESAEQERILQAGGCQLVQGFRYGCAMPANEFTRMLDPSKIAHVH